MHAHASACTGVVHAKPIITAQEARVDGPPTHSICLPQHIKAAKFGSFCAIVKRSSQSPTSLMLEPEAPRDGLGVNIFRVNILENCRS